MTDQLATIIVAVVGSSALAGVVTALAMRGKTRAESNKLDAEAAKVEADAQNTRAIGGITSFAEAAGKLATASGAIDTQWRNVVQGMAAQVDELKHERVQLQTEREDLRLVVVGLRERIDAINAQHAKDKEKERDECDAKIDELRQEFQEQRKSDLEMFTAQLRALTQKPS